MDDQNQAEPSRQTERGGPRVPQPGESVLRAVHPVQEALLVGDQNARAAARDQAPRVLEGPDGVARVVWTLTGEVVAWLERAHYAEHEAWLPLPRRKQTILFSWTTWESPRLNWERKAALLFLQGRPIKALLGPGLHVLRGQPEPAYIPNFGMRDVVLAQVDRDRFPFLSELEIFELLMNPSNTNT